MARDPILDERHPNIHDTLVILKNNRQRVVVVLLELAPNLDHHPSTTQAALKGGLFEVDKDGRLSIQHDVLLANVPVGVPQLVEVASRRVHGRGDRAALTLGEWPFLEAVLQVGGIVLQHDSRDAAVLHNAPMILGDVGARRVLQLLIEVDLVQEAGGNRVPLLRDGSAGRPWVRACGLGVSVVRVCCCAAYCRSYSH